MRVRVRMAVIVSCRGSVAVRPLLLLLSGIRSEIVPPSQYTHHNRRSAYHSVPSNRRANTRNPSERPRNGETSSISPRRPNLTRVSCCTLHDAVLILGTCDDALVVQPKLSTPRRSEQDASEPPTGRTRGTLSNRDPESRHAPRHRVITEHRCT